MKLLPDQPKPFGVPRGCWVAVILVQIPFLVALAVVIYLAQTDLPLLLRWAEAWGL